VRFGPFRVDLSSGQLFRGDARVPIQRQPFEILALLLERPGRMVTREELRARLWPDGTFVDFEHSVNTAIKKLRRALGDSSARPRYVETVPRRGYRFVAPVDLRSDEAAPATGPIGTTVVVLAAGAAGGDGDDAALHERLARSAAIHGGEVVAQPGMDFLAVFEDPEDALRSAFAMQRAGMPAPGADAGGALRVGLALGRSTAAARAEATRPREGAKAGEIRCGAAVARLLSETCAVALREVASTGTVPAGACAVSWDPADPASLLAQVPFVGRGAELERLARRSALAQSGRGGVVLVAGEPGIGKTRLLNELALRARRAGIRVLAGRCVQGGGASPYEPFAEALGQWARGSEPGRLREDLGAGGAALARILPGLRERIPDLPEPSPLRPDEERVRLFDAVARLLQAMAKREPVLLVLDDLQWADGATLALLCHVARVAPQTGLLLVGAHRDVEVGREHPLMRAIQALEREAGFETLPLGGLAVEPIRELLEGIAGRAVSEGFVEALHRATEGNPFFVRELLLHLVRAGRLEPSARGFSTSRFTLETLGVPPGVRALLQERLSGLSKDAQRLLATASAWEGGFPFEIAYRAAGLEEDAGLDALDEALEGQLVHEAGDADRYDFAHALIRHVLYEGLAAPRRARVHRRLGEAAEGVYGERALEHAAEIAAQYHRSAALPGAERGVEYCLAAAARAESTAAFEEQAAFLRRALELAPEGDPRRTPTLAHLGVALAWSGATEEAVRVASEAGELLAAVEGADAAAEHLARAADAVWLRAWDPRAWQLAHQGLRHAGARRDWSWVRLASHMVMAQEAADPEFPQLPRDTPLRREVFGALLANRGHLSPFEENDIWRVSIFDSREQALELAGDLPIPRARICRLHGGTLPGRELCDGRVLPALHGPG
jgi:DNA-binding winged helix-turn-helix (wHTH) protein